MFIFLQNFQVNVFPSLPPYLNQMKSFLRSLNHQRAGRGSAAVKLSAHWLSYIINFKFIWMFFYPISFGILKNYVIRPVSSNYVAIIGAESIRRHKPLQVLSPFQTIYSLLRVNYWKYLWLLNITIFWAV